MNKPVVLPNPMGKTPIERGCVVHAYPTRKQRRLLARNKRLMWGGDGKLSSKMTAFRYRDRAARLAWQVRSIKRLAKKVDGRDA